MKVKEIMEKIKAYINQFAKKQEIKEKIRMRKFFVREYSETANRLDLTDLAEDNMPRKIQLEETAREFKKEIRD